jgi:hypothetical protein
VGKIFLLIRRKPELSGAAFIDHYLDVHAPLALAKGVAKSRYVVGLVDKQRTDALASQSGSIAVAVDAVTIVSMDDNGTFSQLNGSFPSEADQKAMADDHHSFIGVMDTFHVETKLSDTRGAGPTERRLPA